MHVDDFVNADAIAYGLCAFQAGIKDALKKHKLAGNPVCEWRDNKVFWIPPAKIPVEIKNK